MYLVCFPLMYFGACHHLFHYTFLQMRERVPSYLVTSYRVTDERQNTDKRELFLATQKGDRDGDFRGLGFRLWG